MYPNIELKWIWNIQSGVRIVTIPNCKQMSTFKQTYMIILLLIAAFVITELRFILISLEVLIPAIIGRPISSYSAIKLLNVN